MAHDYIAFDVIQQGKDIAATLKSTSFLSFQGKTVENSIVQKTSSYVLQNRRRSIAEEERQSEVLYLVRMMPSKHKLTLVSLFHPEAFTARREKISHQCRCSEPLLIVVVVEDDRASGKKRARRKNDLGCCKLQLVETISDTYLVR